MQIWKSTVSAVAAAALVTLGLAGAAAAAPAAHAKVRHLTATVASVDEKAKTVSVTRSVKGKTQEMTFAVDKDASATLAQLKAGERVKVSYMKSGSGMTAQSITPITHTAQK